MLSTLYDRASYVISLFSFDVNSSVSSYGQLYTAVIDKVVDENMERIDVGKMPTRRRT